jgi:hypothetical protein
MVRPDPVPFAVGDTVRLKKPHPCGGFEWRVVRIGADIGLKCHGCGRRVLLTRRELERRLKARQPVGEAAESADVAQSGTAAVVGRDC